MTPWEINRAYAFVVLPVELSLPFQIFVRDTAEAPGKSTEFTSISFLQFNDTMDSETVAAQQIDTF